MKEDGYTLAEALAALLIISLAMAGLMEGGRMISRLSATAARQSAAMREGREAAALLSELTNGDALADATASGSVTASAAGLEFPCGAGRCGAWLKRVRGQPILEIRNRDDFPHQFRLPAATNPHFVYRGLNGRLESWPDPASRERVKAVSILPQSGEAGLPWVTASVWIEQSTRCEFDLISRSCRRTP